MMERLMARGQELARAAQQRQLQQVGDRLRQRFAGRVKLENENVVVSGRGIVRAWLIDPALRFFGGGLK